MSLVSTRPSSASSATYCSSGVRSAPISGSSVSPPIQTPSSLVRAGEAGVLEVVGDGVEVGAVGQLDDHDGALGGLAEQLPVGARGGEAEAGSGAPAPTAPAPTPRSGRRRRRRRGRPAARRPTSRRRVGRRPRSRTAGPVGPREPLRVGRRVRRRPARRSVVSPVAATTARRRPPRPRPAPADHRHDHDRQAFAHGRVSCFGPGWCETSAHGHEGRARRRCRRLPPREAGAAGAPPALRRLVVPQGQARPGRARDRGRRPRGRRGDRAARPARRRRCHRPALPGRRRPDQDGLLLGRAGGRATTT